MQRGERRATFATTEKNGTKKRGAHVHVVMYLFDQSVPELGGIERVEGRRVGGLGLASACTGGPGPGTGTGPRERTHPSECDLTENA